MKQEDGARIVVTGAADEGQAQRIRNIFQLYPISKLRAAPPVPNPTFGQLLCIAWLAWLLDRQR